MTFFKEGSVTNARPRLFKIKGEWVCAGFLLRDDFTGARVFRPDGRGMTPAEAYKNARPKPWWKFWA